MFYPSVSISIDHWTFMNDSDRSKIDLVNVRSSNQIITTGFFSVLLLSLLSFFRFLLLHHVIFIIVLVVDISNSIIYFNQNFQHSINHRRYFNLITFKLQCVFLYINYLFLEESGAYLLSLLQAGKKITCEYACGYVQTYQ